MELTLAPERAPSVAAESKKFEPSWKRFQETPFRHLPLIVLSPEGDIVHATPAARSVLEYGPDDTLDTCFFAHVHARNQYQVMRDIADMVCYGKSQSTWLLRLRSGKQRWRWYRATVKNRLDEAHPAIYVTLRNMHDW